MARTANAVGCKPNWCTNICYLFIGYIFIGAISYASWAPSIIGMWNLAPDLISSTILSLGPPLMTDGYTAEISRALVSYPPGGYKGGNSGITAAGVDAFNAKTDLNSVEYKSFQSAFKQLDVNNLGYIDIDQFKSYISVDKTLDT